ncbi:MAG: hypothetical protein HQM08_26940 [Candidatus Riflebacteria bacterium]|nr:hypothetical protein [Candidatus Riflebacteria bacterium]
MKPHKKCFPCKFSLKFFFIVQFLFFIFNSPLKAQIIASFSLTDDGVKVEFSYPVSLDGIRVPLNESLLWGQGKIGRSFIAMSKHDSEIGVWDGYSPYIHSKLFEDSCSEINIIPLLSDDGVASGTNKWIFEGEPAEKRKIEKAINFFAENILKRQNENKCFSCHEIIPLGILCTSANDFGYKIPLPILMEICKSIVSFQTEDGSFSFNSSWKYDKTAASLAGSAFLAWNCRWNEKLRGSLFKAARYLVSQQNSDGHLETEFSFPPLFWGSIFSTWLGWEVFSLAERYYFGFTMTELNEFQRPRILAEKFVFEKIPPLFEKLDETSLSIPETGLVSEASRVRIISLCLSKLNDLSFPHDLPIIALLSKKVIRLGGSLRKQDFSSFEFLENPDFFVENLWITLLQVIQKTQPQR